MRLAWCTIAAVLFAGGQAAAQAPAQVTLQSGPLVLSAASTTAFVDSLAGSVDMAVHGFALLSAAPSAADSAFFASRGLTVLGPLAGRVYRVAARPPFVAQQPTLLARIPALALPSPADKLSRALLAPGGGAAVGIVAVVYTDVDPRAVQAGWTSLGIRAAPLGSGNWSATATPAQVRALAQFEFLRWAEPATAPVPDLQTVREAVNANAVQMPLMGIALGLAGRDVDVGLFDTGLDETHRDFNTLSFCWFWWLWACSGPSRVTVNDIGASWHGTFNGGIIGGTGRQSSGTDSWGVSNGGTWTQWRGLAPAARLIDARFLDNNLLNSPRLVQYVTVYGMDVSNHSYSLSWDGVYNVLTASHDALIRGSFAVSGVSVPPRLHVHSAGNFGANYDAPLGQSNQIGYFALGNQEKNALVVGNYNPTENRIASSSSLGPTYDGRIKPDVVAPGTTVIAPGYCSVTESPPGAPCGNPPSAGVLERHGFYLEATGTSASAAVATGIMALTLEAYAREFGVNLDVAPPLPSTLRAIAVHSARDIDAPVWFLNGAPMTAPDGALSPVPVRAFPGPDFTTGYGMMDAQQAVEVVESRGVIEGRIEADCDVRTYSFYVSGSDPSDVMATLAWDDPPSDVALAYDAVHLLNDLDLTLTDPTGARHYPWKLNQRILGAGGLPLDDASQACGTDVTVERPLKPTLTPVYNGTGDPGNVGDELLASDLGPAERGRDHLNNLEKVRAPALPGWWKAEVRGFRLAVPGQPFSLVGVPQRPLLVVVPRSICEILIQCREPLRYICERYPFLCERPQRIPFDTMSVDLRGRTGPQPVLVPLITLCQALGSGAGCGADGAGPTLTVGPTPEPLRVSVLDRAGTIAAQDIRAGQRIQLEVPQARAAGALVLIEPYPSDAREVSVPVRIGR